MVGGSKRKSGSDALGAAGALVGLSAQDIPAYVSMATAVSERAGASVEAGPAAVALLQALGARRTRLEAILGVNAVISRLVEPPLFGSDTEACHAHGASSRA